MASITVDYVLFDLDGTLVSSTDAAEQAWISLCEKNGVDYKKLSEVAHGTRTEEMLAKYFPNVDNTDNKAVKEFELSIANDYTDSVSYTHLDVYKRQGFNNKIVYKPDTGNRNQHDCNSPFQN